MKDRFSRFLCAFLTVVVGFSIFSGCSSKGKEDGSVIAADSPWYDSTSILVDGDYDRIEYEAVDARVLGVVEDQIVSVVSASRRHDPADYMPDSEIALQYYDMSGNLTDTIDVMEKLSSYEGAGDLGAVYTSLFGVDFRRDKVYISGYSSRQGVSYLFCFDPSQKEFVSHEQGDDSSASFMESSRMYEGYSVHCGIDWSDTVFIIEAPDGSVSRVSAGEQIAKEIIAAHSYFYLGDGKLLVFVQFTDFTNDKVIIDLYSGTMSLPGTGEYDWLDDYSEMDIGYYDGVGNVIVDSYGISVIDPQTQSTERILTYDECNVNRSDLSMLRLVYMDEQNIVFSGLLLRGGYLPSEDELEDYSLDLLRCCLITLNKAESNPNAGKTVIRAAYRDGSLSYATAEAIRLFNEQSEDVMIVADMRYSQEALADKISYETGDSDKERERKADAAFITALSIDLLAGEGPDIIFGTIEDTQLNSPDLLLDLRDCVNRDECFTNIIDSAMTGDALYQLPLCFSVDGILTMCENAPAGGAGFTFDEYAELISGPCNGKEPTGFDQVEFFNLCMQQMSGEFYVDGRFEYDNEAFRQLAGFTSEHIFDHDPEEEADIYALLDPTVPTASYVSVRSPRSIIRKIHGPIEEYDVLGLPSTDGRGPVANVRDSIAISTSCKSSEACLQFVSLLTGAEFQQAYAHNCAFPINRNAFITEAYEVVRNTNQLYDEYYSLYYTPVSMSEMMIPGERLDEDAFVDTLISYVDSVSGIGFIDSPVQIIVSEEIQAYFAGQKTLDEIIGIIDNRVDTYVNERAN